MLYFIIVFALFSCAKKNLQRLQNNKNNNPSVQISELEAMDKHRSSNNWAEIYWIQNKKSRDRGTEIEKERKQERKGERKLYLKVSRLKILSSSPVHQAHTSNNTICYIVLTLTLYAYKEKGKNILQKIHCL